MTVDRISPSHEEAEEEFRRILFERSKDGLLYSEALQYFSRALEDRPTLDVTLKLVRNLSKKVRVLDLGCGMGAFEAELCRSSKYECVGLDLDESFVRLAALRLRIHGYQNASFVIGDVRALPFRSNVFDTVVLHDVAAVVNLNDFLREIARAITGRGTFIFDAPVAMFYLMFPTAKRPFMKYSKVDINNALGLDEFVIKRALLTGVPPILQERYHLPRSLLRGVSKLLTSLPGALQEALSQFWYNVLFVAEHGGENA